ncbi:hypothetical protein Q8A67_019273 [Cirrhinus molitorella]|uniref:Uncharacterized protein n=1 Tax=Cirrhinus molitorella TaxID=172907 RepID=A0AA88PF79_9TELE|nr:hypothetical protein Q8A67_019273 [Cirrhinus molitorella]
MSEIRAGSVGYAACCTNEPAAPCHSAAAREQISTDGGSLLPFKRHSAALPIRSLGTTQQRNKAPSRPRKSVERDLERRWRPPSVMDVWHFLTERREHQTAVRLSQDIREEKKSLAESSEDSSVRAAHVSSNSLLETLCFCPQESSSSLSGNAHTHIRRCNPFE